MVATSKPDNRGITATARVRLRADVFAARMTQLGAKTKTAQAELLGMHRTALAHIISGRKLPSLPRAIDMSERMGLAVEELFEKAAA